jgi:hypothetical protein
LQTMKWYRIPSMPEHGRIHCSAVLVDELESEWLAIPGQQQQLSSSSTTSTSTGVTQSTADDPLSCPVKHLYVIGGTSRYNLLSSIITYNMSTRLWNESSSLRLKQGKCGLTSHYIVKYGVLLCIGGIIDNNTGVIGHSNVATDDIEVMYLNKTLTRSNTTGQVYAGVPLPRLQLLTPRAYHTSVYDSSSHHLYVMGGFNHKHQVLKSCEVINITTGNHTFIQPMRYPRVYAASCIYNNRIYVFGGSSNYHRYRVYSDVEIYDIHTSSWIASSSSIITMMHPRAGHTCNAYNNKIYIVGGSGINGLVSVNEIFNIQSMTSSEWPIINNNNNNANNSTKHHHHHHRQQRDASRPLLGKKYDNDMNDLELEGDGNNKLQIQRAWHSSCF